MTETPVSLRVTKQLSGLVRRLRDNPDFMAFVLAAYQRQERLSDDALAKYLNTTPAMLPRLALCKRPASNSPQFADQVRQIAAYTDIDAAKLANMVRQVDTLEKLAEQPEVLESEKAGAQQIELRPGLLAATRDRYEREPGEEMSSQPNDETSSED